jgi:hypothetical protein
MLFSSRLNQPSSPTLLLLVYPAKLHENEYFRGTNWVIFTLLQLQKYMDLPQQGCVQAEYIWIDGSNGVRSKTKVRREKLDSQSL